MSGIENIDESKFPGIYDYWIRHGKESQHEQMAAHYLKILIDGIAEYDNYQHSAYFYKWLALKAGLEGTVTWNSYSPARQDQADKDFENVIKNGNYQCN